VAELGRPEPPDHVFVDRAVVEDLAGASCCEDPKWQAGLSAMIEYAAQHGWVDADGRIRAHVEHLDKDE
jgi:hypothetical protein